MKYQVELAQGVGFVRVELGFRGECDGRKNESKLTCSVFRALQLTLLILFTAMIGGCTGTEDSNHKEAAMRNEIIAYVKSYDANYGEKGKDYRVDVTHVVEKYIKMGDSYETAKEVLLKNGFSVREYSVEEAANRKDIRITYRISYAHC